MSEKMFQVKQLNRYFENALAFIEGGQVVLIERLGGLPIYYTKDDVVVKSDSNNTDECLIFSLHVDGQWSTPLTGDQLAHVGNMWSKFHRCLRTAKKEYMELEKVV